MSSGPSSFFCCEIIPYLIRIVESTDARMFGLDDAEVQKRRRYVGHVRKEIEVSLFA